MRNASFLNPFVARESLAGTRVSSACAQCRSHCCSDKNFVAFKKYQRESLKECLCKHYWFSTCCCMWWGVPALCWTWCMCYGQENCIFQKHAKKAPTKPKPQPPHFSLKKFNFHQIPANPDVLASVFTHCSMCKALLLASMIWSFTLMCLTFNKGNKVPVWCQRIGLPSVFQIMNQKKKILKHNPEFL